MDLKQPLSLKTLGKGGKAPAYPTKTAINLIDSDRKRGNLFTQLGLFVVVLVLVGIFAKFAVVDPLASSMASNSEVAQAQAQLDALKAENANYADLNEEYARYIVTGLTEDEQNLVDRDTVLDLLQEKVLNVGYLSSLKVSGNTAVVTCLGVDLTKVSLLVQDVEADERVAHVTVSTAQGETDASTQATIEITFTGPLEVEAGDDIANAMAEATGEGVQQ